MIDDDVLEHKIMASLGFLPTDTGPYVQEVREAVRKKIAKGMTSTHGFWSPYANQGVAEDRAKAWLSLEWAIDHSHSYQVKAMDGLRRVQRNLLTGKKTVRWNFHWFGDRWREAGARVRRVLSGPNPYL